MGADRKAPRAARWCCATRTRSTAAPCAASSSPRCSAPCPRRATGACGSTSAASKAASGEHGAGETEPTDVRAAIDTATGFGVAGVLAVVGWSFGGDMALSIDDPRVDGWVGIAPPLRFGSRFGAVAADPRPKHLVLAQHDEFRLAGRRAGGSRDVDEHHDRSGAGRESLLRGPHRSGHRRDERLPRPLGRQVTEPS